MQKVDYLQEKINGILNELNYLKAQKVETYEVVYDKNSEDEKVNWNLKNGILGGKAKSGVNFLKFKRLRVYVMFANKISYTGEIPLENPNPTTTKREILANFRVGDEDASQSIYYILLKITDLTYIVNMTMGFYTGSTNYTRDNNSGYYIYKIEGIY